MPFVYVLSRGFIFASGLRKLGVHFTEKWYSDNGFVIIEETHWNLRRTRRQWHKEKGFLIIALVCVIGIGISAVFLSGRRPFKNLGASDIASASVRLMPPDTTIQVTEIEELVSYLNEIVIYNEDNSYTEYAGQAVVFMLDISDGSQVEITASNPFIIINGVAYKCKYEPCEALNHYANSLMLRDQ